MATETPKDQLLSQERKDEIIKTLKGKGVPHACPMCGSNGWVIADGFFAQTIQADFKGIRLGGASIPSIAILCQNCGFMSQHALGALGLLPASDTAEEKK